MIVEVPDGVAVALSSVTWFAVSMVIGWRAASWPDARLARTGPFTTLHAWEAEGEWWDRRWAVRRWKDRLPEAGAFFAGGRSMRHLPSRSPADLGRFRAETVRAERVHWSIMASWPIHLVWCRPAIAAWMAAFGVVFNLPFIAVQRFNRGRVDRLRARAR